MDRCCPVCGRPMFDKKKKALRILGLSGWEEKDITPEVIKKAYHSLARISHPDMGGDAEVFTEVKEARRLLEMATDSENMIEEIGRDTIIRHVRECQKTWQPGMQCPLCRR